MIHPHHFELDEAKKVGDKLGVDWTSIEPEQFRQGLEFEFEHGSQFPETDITHDDPLVTGQLAWAHLKDIPDYYTRLEDMVSEAQAYWEAAKTG
jgi:hypothetical protein